MSRFVRLAAMLLLGLAAWSAHAAVTCSVAVSSMTVAYDPTDTGNTVITGSYTVSCTRAGSDANTFNWTLGANNGTHASGAQNRVQLGTRTYNYELYRTTPYTNANRWQDAAATRFTGTLSFGGLLSGSQTGSFDIVIPGPQTVRPAGNYTDTVTVTLRNAATGITLGTDTFGVSVITNASCTLGTPPGNINFAYTSFQVTAASASTTFRVNCTTNVPYTMSLDATSGTLLGLPYTLALSQSAGTGTGTLQTYSINGSIVGGLPGTCSTGTCSASATRTLTISY